MHTEVGWIVVIRVTVAVHRQTATISCLDKIDPLPTKLLLVAIGTLQGLVAQLIQMVQTDMIMARTADLDVNLEMTCLFRNAITDLVVPQTVIPFPARQSPSIRLIGHNSGILNRIDGSKQMLWLVTRFLIILLYISIRKYMLSFTAYVLFIAE